MNHASVAFYLSPLARVVNAFFFLFCVSFSQTKFDGPEGQMMLLTEVDETSMQRKISLLMTMVAD